MHKPLQPNFVHMRLNDTLLPLRLHMRLSRELALYARRVSQLVDEEQLCEQVRRGKQVV